MASAGLTLSVVVDTEQAELKAKKLLDLLQQAKQLCGEIKEMLPLEVELCGN